MNLKGMFKKTPVERNAAEEAVITNIEMKNPEIPDGLWVKCPGCGKVVLLSAFAENHYICPKCGKYLRMTAKDRIQLLTDAGTFVEWETGLENRNPLRMKEYPDKIEMLKQTTGNDEAVVCGLAKIGGYETVLMVMDCHFLTGSMGEVVGEKITRSIERATEAGLPVVIVCCSGGARMQEGIVSLMQMAKTSAALKRHSDAGLLSINVLTDPTTGGVTASFAMLGDIILAEPEALIGFAGPRVIEQTIRQKLPKGFQRSEFLLEHGFIDAIVERDQLKEELAKLLGMHLVSDTQQVSEKQQVLENLPSPDLSRKKLKTPWERVALARDKDRPVAEDYIRILFEDFTELHGDRQFGDDPAICGGIAYFEGQPVTVLAQMKGKNTKENLKRNFAMPKPEGYRKALRLMKQAEKFHRPIICFVDTPGAFCGLEAEERGEGEAIARNLFEMSSLKTPILSILIGEGGSGGALALAVADEVWAMENAIYSILSPEGFASILWKDASLAQKAAKVMRLTSYDLYQLGVIDYIFEEPDHFTAETLVGEKQQVLESQQVSEKQQVSVSDTHLLDIVQVSENQQVSVFDTMKGKIGAFLSQQAKKSEEQLVEERYQRFRR